jgi:hypothetical protein
MVSNVDFFQVAPMELLFSGIGVFYQQVVPTELFSWHFQISRLPTLTGEDDTLLLAPTSARRGQTPQLHGFFSAGARRLEAQPAGGNTLDRKQILSASKSFIKN